MRNPMLTIETVPPLAQDGQLLSRVSSRRSKQQVERCPICVWPLDVEASKREDFSAWLARLP